MDTLSAIKSRLDDLLLGDGPPSLASVEDAARLLRQFREQAGAPAAPEVAPRSEAEFAETNFGAVQMGASPADLHEAVRHVWDGFAQKWACAATVEGLLAELARLHEPLKEDASNLDKLERDTALAERRLKTLKSLRDLLDELVTTGLEGGEEDAAQQPPHPPNADEDNDR